MSVKVYKGYLLDLDGTIYRGSEAVPGAKAFLAHLREEQIPYLFLTNNSSATPQQVAKRLQQMGIEATADEVYTSSMATAQYLSERDEGAGVYVIGEEGLRTELVSRGFVLTEESAKYVVVGIDREFSYEKLANAARAVRNGAALIATNGDAALPTDHGLTPGNGSLVAAVAVASGAEATFIGKPEPIIVRYALSKLGTNPADTLVVGDNLHTDIEAGANSGLDSLLVLTGYSNREDAQRHTVQPTHVAEDLAEWLRRITL